MAVTLYRKRKVINNIIIRNGVAQKEEKHTDLSKEIKVQMRGKMYGRRTVNRQN